MFEENNTPKIFNASEEKAEFQHLIKDDSIKKLDLFEAMKTELKKTILFGKTEIEKGEALNKIDPIWIYFPWEKAIIKSLPKEMFIALRTARNLYKITREEQLTLSEKTIGVVGLSVGRTVSTTLALERICGTLRIADFDDLELSNLNRLKAPLKDYGLKKTISTQREIHGFDPFIEVSCFHDGLTSDNIDSFFTKSGKLDLVIDECDSLEMKIKLRQKAKSLGIPVIMDTSDRGMLDIERFDKDPKAQLFNGLIGDFNPASDWKMTPEEHRKLLAQILDFEKISTRGKQSLAEIGKTISTWPQLATAVVLGGGVAAEISRRILLGEDVPSGRYYIDLDELIPNGRRG